MVPIRCSSSVHHVDGEDLLFLAPLAQKGYGVSRGHVLPNGNQAGGHYSAARIFRMGHEPAYFVRLYDIHQPQDSFAAVLGQISQYVGSVVRCHFLPPGRRGFLRPASRQFCARYGNPPWQASLQPGVWPLAPGPGAGLPRSGCRRDRPDRRVAGCSRSGAGCPNRSSPANLSSFRGGSP